jgi:hypothetical protein
MVRCGHCGTIPRAEDGVIECACACLLVCGPPYLSLCGTPLPLAHPVSAIAFLARGSRHLPLSLMPWGLGLMPLLTVYPTHRAVHLGSWLLASPSPTAAVSGLWTSHCFTVSRRTLASAALLCRAILGRFACSARGAPLCVVLRNPVCRLC